MSDNSYMRLHTKSQFFLLPFKTLCLMVSNAWEEMKILAVFQTIEFCFIESYLIWLDWRHSCKSQTILIIFFKANVKTLNQWQCSFNILLDLITMISKLSDKHDTRCILSCLEFLPLFSIGSIIAVFIWTASRLKCDKIHKMSNT